MTIRWLTAVAVLGLILGTQADVVTTNSYGTEEATTDPPKYDTTPALETEDTRLTCYDCTSYMPACKYRVKDVEEIVSRSGCKSKCFLRVGEEKSGALYRGCMDDFVSAQLRTDYVGCQVQEWNGRKMLWCLCDNNLCNGQSLKGIFYSGYGGEKATPAYRSPEGKSYKVNPGDADVAFEKILDNVDNINDDYSEDSKKDAVVDEALAYPAPVKSTEPETKLGEGRVEEGYESVKSDWQEEKIQHPPQEYPQPNAARFHPQDYRQLPLYPTDPRFFHNLPYRAYPYPYLQPQYPLDARHKVQEFEQPDMYGSKVSFPNSQSYPPMETYYDMPGRQLPPVSPLKPHGKVANVGSAPSAHQYSGLADAFDIEPLTYFPYEKNDGDQNPEDGYAQDVKVVDDQPELLGKSKADAVGYTGEEADSELYCPTAGIYTYEEDCSKFVLCLMDNIKGKPRMYIMQCPSGLVFDNRANTCMLPGLSGGCKRLPTSGNQGVVPTTIPEETPVKTENVVHGTGYQDQQVHFQQSRDEGVIQNLDYDYFDNNYKGVY